ncbi:trigger factor [Thermosulfuriphilus sp.]
MRVSVEDLSSVQKRLEVELPPEMVDKELNQAYARLRKEVKLKGFRKGHAPKELLKRLFRDRVEEEVTEKLISETLPKAISQSKLVPVVRPQVSSYEALRENESFSYSVVVDIRPEFELPEYEGLELEAMDTEVSEQEVENQLKALQYTFANFKEAPEDHSLGKGDVVIVSVEVLESGERIPGLSTESLYIDVGTGEFNATVEDALVGHKKGETVEVEITHPEDALNEALAGKTVLYRAQIKEIYIRELPPLDDTFVERLQAGFKDLEDLKERIRQRLKKEKERRAEEYLKEQILEQLRSRVDFEVPERFIEYKIEQMVEQMAQNLQEQGQSFEEAGISVERLRRRLHPLAEQQAKEELILEKIAEKENIGVDGPELEARVEQLVRALGARGEELRGVLATSMVPKLIAEKTLRFLLDKAKIKQKDDTEIERNETEKQEG